MKVLLVIPKDEHVHHRESMIPLGIAYINGALRKNGFNVVSYNLNYISESLKDFLERVVAEEDIDILLTGGTSYDYSAISRLFAIAKYIKPQIITIGGGAGYTAQPILFSEMTNPDYAIIGEGEESVCELIQTLENEQDVSCVKGILYRNNGEYHFTGERALIDDVNSIAFPSYEGFEVERLFHDLDDYDSAAHFDYETMENPRVLPMLFGRSCPYGCKFCFHTIGRKYRARSLDNFFCELDELLEKYHISGITIMDEFFGVKEDVIYEFCERIKPYNIKWFAEVRVDVVNNAILKAMKDAGCTNLLMGLESMDENILRDMEKGITVEQIDKALESVYHSGLTISGNFIAVSEKETLESFYRTFDWWNTHRKYQIDFVHLQLYPGTAYYKNAVQKSLIKDEELYIKCVLPELNSSELTKFEWDKVKRIMQFSRIDHVMDGRIEAYEEIGNQVRFSLVCRHCNQRFVKTVKRDGHFQYRKYKFKCPECEHKSDFQLNQGDTYLFDTELYKQLTLNNLYDVDMKTWFAEKNYKKVVLLGNGHNLMIMKKEAQRAGVCVRALTDCVIERLQKYQGTLFDDPIVAMDNIRELQQIDAVIICYTLQFPEYYKMLRKCGYEGKIDSIVNAVLQHDYFLDSNVW